MIIAIQNNRSKFLLESVIPVIVVFAALFVLILVVRMKSGTENNTMVVIEIPAIVTKVESDTAEAESSDQLMLEGGEKQKGQDNPLYAEAKRHIEAKNWDQARRIYEQILQDGRDTQIYEELGMMYLKKGELPSALEFFNKAVALPSPSISAYFNRGVCFTKMADLDKAVADFNRVIKVNPYHFEAHYNLGLALLERKAYADAIGYLQTASKLAGGVRKAKALHNLGVAYKRSGRKYFDKANEAYHASIRIKPDYIAPRFGLAALEPDTKEGLRNAIQIYTEILELSPSSAMAYFMKARAHVALGEEDLAMEDYKSAVQHGPDNLKARYNLALIYLNQQRLGDAKQQFDAILAQDPQNHRATLQLGRIAMKNKNYTVALEKFNQALELKKGHYPEASLNIGLVQKKLGNYQAALENYQEALKYKQNYPKAWYNIGLVQMNLKHLAKAEEAFRKAVKLQPKFASAWFNLGYVLSRLKKPNQSKSAYLSALVVKPNYPKAMINLGILYAITGEHEEAVKMYQAVLQKDFTYTSAWTNLGEVYLRMREYENAEEAFRRSLDLEPDNANVRRSMATTLDYLGDYDGAAAHLQHAANIKPSEAAIRLQLARIMLKQGKQRAALASLDRALALDPTNQEVRQEWENLGKSLK